MLRLLKRKLRQMITSRIDPFRDEMFFQIDSLKFSQGQMHARMQNTAQVGDLQQTEFKVYSQWGEDGIIQYLTRVVPIPDRAFVEIGVEDYYEANTRFLLMNNNWRGLIIDGNNGHERFLERSGLRWRHTIEPITAFVTRENVNDLIAAAGYKGDIGLLSLDIDGMDYWVLQAITAVSPRIIVVEYNSRFGCSRPVTVPYDAGFCRTKAHYSNCYYGASLPALCRLAGERGYAFVGTTSAGGNAFFVRNDVLPADLAPVTPKGGFTRAHTREGRHPDGTLAYFTEAVERQLIADLPVLDVESNEIIPLKILFERG